MISNKNKFYTNRNLIYRLGAKELPSVDATFDVNLFPDNFYYRECCDDFKPQGSYINFIPADFLENFGYTEEDLKRWLELISLPGKGNFNFKYTYYGLKSIESFKSFWSTECASYSDGEWLKGKVTTDRFYVVGFDSRKKAAFDCYLYIILMRCIYNHYYFDIPETVFQLKKELPELTDFQAILMAQFKRRYNTSYGLMGSSYPANPLCKTTLTKIRSMFREHGMVSGLYRSFDGSKVSFYIAQDLLKEKKYKELYDYFKSLF